MKLYAKAALSLNKRRLLVQRIVEQGWSLTKAVVAAEVNEPTARKWVRPPPIRRCRRPGWSTTTSMAASSVSPEAPPTAARESAARHPSE